MYTIINELEGIIKNNTPEQFTFSLNELPDHNNYLLDIRKDGKFIDIFNALNIKINDCLYWFSVPCKADAQKLKTRIDERRESLKQLRDKRIVPAKNNNIDSNILYVGVRKGGYRKYTIINKKRVPDGLSNIAGRIIQHLGYYIKGTTQGLQLFHWANDLDISITLNVIEYKNLRKDYLYIIEKLYAIKLKPVLGKH